MFKKILDLEKKLIKKIIDTGILTPAQARTLEVFVIAQIGTLLLVVIDGIYAWASGNDFDWKVAIGAVLLSSWTAIRAGMTKGARDASEKLTEEIAQLTGESKTDNSETSE